MRENDEFGRNWETPELPEYISVVGDHNNDMYELRAGNEALPQLDFNLTRDTFGNTYNDFAMQAIYTLPYAYSTFVLKNVPEQDR